VAPEFAAIAALAHSKAAKVNRIIERPPCPCLTLTIPGVIPNGATDERASIANEKQILRSRSG